MVKTKDISIHALAKRATKSRRCLYHSCQYFNPRPRKEGDDRRVSADSLFCYFNPRPRKEGDVRQSTRDPSE